MPKLGSKVEKFVFVRYSLLSRVYRFLKLSDNSVLEARHAIFSENLTIKDANKIELNSDLLNELEIKK